MTFLICEITCVLFWCDLCDNCVCVRARVCVCACECHVDSIKCKSSQTSSLTNEVIQSHLKACGSLIYHEKQEASRKCILCSGKSYFVNNRYLKNSKEYASIIRLGKTNTYTEANIHRDRQTAMEIDKWTDG